MRLADPRERKKSCAFFSGHRKVAIHLGSGESVAKVTGELREADKYVGVVLNEQLSFNVSNRQGLKSCIL